jgi:DNA-damage-inducible protein D
MSETVRLQLEFIVQALEGTKKVLPSGAEIWDARTLSSTLKYSDWTNFKLTIERAISACDNSGIFSSNHFREFTDMVEIGSGAKRKIENWHLSRYACYLVAMNGDSNKPEIATAQSYFAAQTLKAEKQELLTEEQRRILLRDRVRGANKKLGGAAKDAGVRSHMFGVFQDAGYKGLYGGRGMQEIKAIKKIDKSDDLLDCIGRAELAMNEFRITQTEEKLRTEGIKGEHKAIVTHHEVGRKVRAAVKQIGGKLPEEHAAEPSVKKILAANKKRDKLLAKVSKGENR